MNPVKFDFDTEFDANGEILREGESYKRFFTQEDVDAARMWGVEEGREMEEGRCAQSLQAIASQMQLIVARLANESDALRHEAAGLRSPPRARLPARPSPPTRSTRSRGWPARRCRTCAQNRNCRCAARRTSWRPCPSAWRARRAMPAMKA